MLNVGGRIDCFHQHISGALRNRYVDKNVHENMNKNTNKNNKRNRKMSIGKLPSDSMTEIILVMLMAMAVASIPIAIIYYILH